MPSKLGPVRVEDDLVLAGPHSSDTISLVGLGGVEVEDEEKFALLGDDHLITLIHQAHILVAALMHEAERFFQALHGRVEVVEMDVTKMRLIGEVPLAASMMIGPVVADAREVDPLRMSEFVTHEVEVSLSSERHGDQSDHLVQGDSSVDDGVGGGEEGHAVVHLLVHEPEGDGLVTNKRLIVRFGVANNLLLVSSVCQRVYNMTHLPLIVRHLLQELDPHIRSSHGKTIVEAETSLMDRAAERWHARNILGDADGPGPDGVDHVVGKHKVDASIHVGVQAEVLAVSVHEAAANTVMLVEDGSHTVKAEAIELVLFQPPAQVGEKKSQNLVSSVVEDARVPERVVSFRPLVEVLVMRPVELIDSVDDVLGSVGMNNIKKNRDSHAVSSVDEALQGVRITASRRRGEEVCNVITEGSIVRVLLDSHELNGVVAQALDTWKNTLTEQIVRVDVGLSLRRHSNVCLVNPQRLGSCWELVLELVLRGGIPEHRIVRRVSGSSLGRLHAVVGPSWDPGGLLASSGGDGDLVSRAVGDERGSIRLLGDVEVPDTVLIPLVRILSSIPPVEISHQCQVLGARCPFSSDDAWAVRVFAAMNAIRMKTFREFLQRTESVDDMLLPLLVPPVPVLQGALAALKVGVPLDNLAAILRLPVVVGDLVPWHVLRLLQDLAALASSLALRCQGSFCRGCSFSSSKPERQVATVGLEDG
mmetsp:Transcript_40311/g.126894  ORF Transcript_40311/g.126894 Transcript_40311/m.126894 type:complete len:704 (-) Transcript_40311:165-2276(-)